MSVVSAGTGRVCNIDLTAIVGNAPLEAEIDVLVLGTASKVESCDYRNNQVIYFRIAAKLLE